MPKNRLARETSPYLLQHAENPVDWYPWNEEALEFARESGKPLLLSVGYSACHWCHVMAHESFEDEATAAVMNELFVNIKVDREERPDIDSIYQTAHQLLTQRAGGWPLTMFIDPATQLPFFGGTYFPREARHGMPSFRELLHRIADYYRTQPDNVRQQGAQLKEIFGQLDPPGAEPVDELDDTILVAGREKIGSGFDQEFGGFGKAPKFPHPTTLEWLLRYWRASAESEEPDLDALYMVSLTMTRMAEGGIYDQLGGGFCRYSVDRYWQIPHFEKMLYDNGPLLALYAQLHLATGDGLFARVANESADWMIDDMRADNNGFYSTRDADSEGEEGRYYVWDISEVESLLESDAYELFADRYGLNLEPNFEDRWHLTIRKTLAELAAERHVDVQAIEEALSRSRTLLLEHRMQRVAPARDEKQLTSWNALAIRGLAIAGRALEREDLCDRACEAVDFLCNTMMTDGRLHASHKDGRTRFPAYLDDHAFLIDAILESLQGRWRSDHLAFACLLADLLLAHFFDGENGGFYFTADDHEQLMHRQKPLADDATPSGNGVAALSLQRLGFLLGEPRYLEAAELTLRSAARAMREYPHGHVSLLAALEEYLKHPEIIVIRGEAGEINRWRNAAERKFSPGRLVYAIPENETGLPGALADRRPRGGSTVAYRCVGTSCSLPMTSWEALAEQMR